MARFNTIFAGPVTQNTPQVQEAPASAPIIPGSLIVLSGGEYALAGASTTGKVWIAQENYLAQKGVDAAYAENDVVIGLELLDDQFYNARVPTGTNVAKGAALVPGASGALVLAAAGSKQVVAFAEEAFNNTSGSTQLVRVRPAKGYLTPAS